MNTPSARALQLLALASALSLATACGDKDDDFDTGATADTTAPVITLLGDDPLLVEYGDTFTDPGATATDDVDPMVDVIVSGEVDTSVLGDVILSYDAVDSAGNEAETVTRTVSVVDTTPPTITLIGDNPMSIVEGSVFEDPGATATDAVDGDVAVTVTGTVDASLDGSYVLSYDAVDAAGNAAATVERTVDVTFAGQLALAANGSSLLLVGQRTDGLLVERASADIDFGDAVYNTNHQIFNIAVNPVNGDVYTTSFNECGAVSLSTDGCWGNARIDRFSYGINGLTHEGAAFLLQGPVRFLEPVVDASGTEVSVTLLNQSPDDLDIVEVGLTGSEPSMSLVSGCDGTTLAPGDSCELTFTASDASDILGGFTVLTSVGDVTASMYLNSDESAPIIGDTYGDWSSTLDLPGCVDDGWSANQIGSCAPTALAISQDGSRVFVNDDHDDHGLVFAVETDGSLSFLSAGESRSMRQQGVAVNGDGSVVYNGGNSFSTTGDVLVAEEVDHGGGNATEVFELGGVELLASTITNSELAIFDLTTPLEPVLIDTVSPAGGKARYQHHSADASRFVTVDHEDLVVYAFDGAELTELSSSEIPVDLGEDLCEACDYRGANRVVQMSADGTQAMTGVFVNAYDEEAHAVMPFYGQVRSFAIDASTGEATEIDALDLPGMTRALLVVPRR